MKALAQGKNKEVIETMIKHLINSTQGSQFETFLSDEGIRDIAEVISTEKPLYSGEELNNMSMGAVQVRGGEEEVKYDEKDMEHMKISRNEDFSREVE